VLGEPVDGDAPSACGEQDLEHLLGPCAAEIAWAEHAVAVLDRQGPEQPHDEPAVEGRRVVQGLQDAAGCMRTSLCLAQAQFVTRTFVRIASGSGGVEARREARASVRRRSEPRERAAVRSRPTTGTAGEQERNE
jgi:hypothetical protein